MHKPVHFYEKEEKEMRKFYLALAAGSQVTTTDRFKFPSILINFQSKISSSLKRKDYHDSIFVDCGGFSSSLIAGGYRTSDAEYLVPSTIVISAPSSLKSKIKRRKLV